MKKSCLIGAGLCFALGSTAAFAEVTSLSGAEYATLCQQRGVPLPPTWGNSAWKYNGYLTDENEYILQYRQANVYYFASASPPGLCMTLPRSTAGTGAIEFASFGVICQGNNGKVCFWDNATEVPWDDNNGATVFSAQKVIASTNPNLLDGTFIGGAALASHKGGMCTDCHAGLNPFIVHPGTAVDLMNVGVAQNTGIWYDPIVPSGWLQNPGPGTALDGVPLLPGEGSCQSCHLANGASNGAGPFPAVTTANRIGFCGIILQQARDRKFPAAGMPPFTYDPATLSFERHYEALANACLQPPDPHQSPLLAMPPSPRFAMHPSLIVATHFLML